MRPAFFRAAALACAIGLTVSCTESDDSSESADPAKASAIRRIVTDAMAQAHLRWVIVKVSVDGKNVLTEAFGESMTGVPATPDMHFRIGAVNAIPFMATLLFVLADEKKVGLDDKVSTWLPDLPNGNRVSLRQLAQMTSGYADYVQSPDLGPLHYGDPFRHFTPEDLIALAKPETLLYEPGTNWSYAHTNYVILGLAIEKITGQPVDELMRDKVLGPLGLDNTTDPGTPAIPEPTLHAFTAERRDFLGVPDGASFYEETTYWDPSWSISRGAIQTSTIDDVHDGVIGWSTGKLLSKESYQEFVSPQLRGNTTHPPNCPTCKVMDDYYTAGYGVILTGDWLMRTMFLSGYAGAQAYLPSQKTAVAVFVTYAQEAYNDRVVNQAEPIFRQIGALVAPTDAPPVLS